MAPTTADVRATLARPAGAVQDDAPAGPTVADVRAALRGQPPAAATTKQTTERTNTSAPVLDVPAAAGGSYTTADDVLAAVEEIHQADRPLPDDVPGHAALLAAGITTIEQLWTVDDPTRIDGIGPATARKLEDWIQAHP